ncbi:MAG: hypothetical protein H0V81_02540 [Solirubrobacterales bacterium]|nr:hypothetical protein [Solirubrobacterales bacterium]
MELDRSAAVSHAIQAADPGDLVLILDRGERSGELLRPDGTAAAFDDREQARAALAARAVAPGAPGPRG